MSAPIVISVYNRPEHLKRCVASLAANPEAEETELYIVSDAPAVPQHKAVVEEIRKYVRSIEGFKSVTLLAWEENKGSTRSITDARSLVFEKYDVLIFMEDDNVVSPYFLNYINAGLEKYRDVPDVYCICGYNYNVPPPTDYSYDCYFMYAISAYGYAVWKEKYEAFYRNYRNPDCKSKEYKRYLRCINQPAFFLKRMLKQNVIWGDVRVTYYLYSNNMVSLFPCKSLVENTGYDKSGEHCDKYKIKQQEIAESTPIRTFPPTTDIDSGWEKAICKYFEYPFLKRCKTCFYDWRREKERSIKKFFLYFHPSRPTNSLK